MTSDDVSTVQQSWVELRRRRAALLDELTRRFEDAGSPAAADLRAAWLLTAVEALVDLLSAPSGLAPRARELGETWPVPGTAPCLGLEGQAWLAAAGACSPNWSQATERAWRQGWLLMCDVLAAETISPFTDRLR